MNCSGYPTIFDEIDNSMCINCPHADGACWKAGRCLQEDYE